jgi:Na+-driven multidrug efflux pump
MIANIPANWGGFVAASAVIIAYVLIIALVIICLIRASRYFMNPGKEQKLIRMELGKLAEEVHQLRHQLGGEKGANTSSQSE